MAASTVSISEASQQILHELVERTGAPPMDILDKALDAYRRLVYFDKMNAGYAAVRADPSAWAEMQSEQKLWDTTLLDGLDTQERWTDDGRCLNAGEQGN